MVTCRIVGREDAPALIPRVYKEQQLLSYVHWATLKSFGENRGKFEQGGALASYEVWEQSSELLTDEDVSAVAHNPTPSML